MSEIITFPLPLGPNYTIPDVGDLNWGQQVTNFLVAIPNGVVPTQGTFTLTGDLSFGASFGLVTAYVKSGASNIASAGFIRMAKTDTIDWRNNANSANLALAIDSSDNLTYNGNIIAGSSVSPVTSITGTSNQVIASSPTGAVTLSLPQSIDVSALVNFQELTLGIGSSVLGQLRFFDNVGPHSITIKPGTSSATYSLTLPTTQGAISTFLQNNGSGVLSWVTATGSGTVTGATANQLAYYASTGSTVSGLTSITASRALASDSNGLPVASATTATELGYVSGVTSAIQTQLNSAQTQITANLAASQYTFQNAIQFENVDTLSTASTTYVNTNLTAIIVPTSSSSRIKITITGNVNAASADGFVTVTSNSTDLALNGSGFLHSSVSGTSQVALTVIDSPATSSFVRYTVQVKKGSGGSFVWNPSGNTAVMILEELR
jgi:hypothetical protein